MQLLTSLFLGLLSATFAQSESLPSGSARTTTVYAWPLSSPPSKLAEIEYSPEERSASVLSYTPPTSYSNNAVGLVGIGLYNSSTKTWLGTTVTSAASFEPGCQGTISLHVNAEGGVWRAAFHASRRGASLNQNGRDIRDEKPRVEILRPAAAPQPQLNRAVVLSPDGKVPEKEVERTFLQK